MIKPEVNLCVSALGWVGGWIFSVVPDRWKHWNHSHRSKTHRLPNRNVLAVSLPHKQAFEGRWARRRTDGRHSRVNTHAEGQTGAGWTQTIIGQVSDGQPVEKEKGGDTDRCHYQDQMHHQLFHGAEKAGQIKGRRVGGKNHRNKMQIPTTRFTLETTDLITNHGAGYSRC